MPCPPMPSVSSPVPPVALPLTLAQPKLEMPQDIDSDEETMRECHVTATKSITSWSTEEGRHLRRRMLSHTASSSWQLSPKEHRVEVEAIPLISTDAFPTVLSLTLAFLSLLDPLREAPDAPNDDIAEELLQEIEHLVSFRHPDLVMFIGFDAIQLRYFMSSGKQPFEHLGKDPEKILQEYLKGNEPRHSATKA
eukprot:Skav215186  [mRNA]  locus=scaffold3330:58826:61911:- [translate_table: standard]